MYLANALIHVINDLAEAFISAQLGRNPLAQSSICLGINEIIK